MKIAILGYGKMGQMIEHLCDKKHGIVYIKKDHSWDIQALKKADVAIEFSVPDAAVENIKTCIINSVPVVSGTTGWIDQMKEIENEVQQHNGSFMYGSNFSIGMNIFFKINQILADYMKLQDSYDCYMDEAHHKHKLDKPSGTAITLADDIVAKNTKYSDWTLDKTNKENQIYIDVKREGEITGYHAIHYSSDFDEISISHNAKKRASFAQGAIHAAEWLHTRKGFYTVGDFMNDIINKS